MRHKVPCFRIDAVLLFLVAGLAMAACNGPLQESRETRSWENVPVDSLRFYPTGMRFLQKGDDAVVHLRDIQTGYACSRISRLDLTRSENVSGAVIDVRVDVELPAYPDCPVSAGRDSLVDFSGGAGLTGKMFLRNTRLEVTDSLREIELPESPRDYRFIPKTAGTDTLILDGDEGAAPDTVIYGVSAGYPLISLVLSVCDSVNFAQYRILGDTVSVRLSVVAFAEEAEIPEACRERSIRGVTAYPVRD